MRAKEDETVGMTGKERDDLLKRMQSLDERDLSDDARWWGELDAEVSAVPESKDELAAALALAFEAGRLSTSRPSFCRRCHGTRSIGVVFPGGVATPEACPDCAE